MVPDISVIIAAYNVEAYIERAIQSALSQEGVTVEVIVVNDASTDNTRDIVAGINDPRIKFLNMPTNAGPGAARNIGIESAIAPWIAILDGDDIFLPGRLARCLMRVKAFDADIIVDNLELCCESDGIARPMFTPYRFNRYNIIDLAAFIGHNRTFLGGGEAYGYFKPIFKTEFLRRHGLRYDPTLRIGEDYLLMCEALANGARCVVEPSVGYRYTARAGSISHRLTLTDIEHIADGDKKFLTRYKLDAAAMAAQEKRNNGLKEAAVYTKLVNAIKQRDIKAAARAIGEYPSAARHLWEPVWVRIEKVFKRSSKRESVAA